MVKINWLENFKYVLIQTFHVENKKKGMTIFFFFTIEERKEQKFYSN